MLDFIWDSAKSVWPTEPRLIGNKDTKLKADVLIDLLKNKSNLYDFFSPGNVVPGSQRKYKLWENAVIDKYVGTYYGE